MTPFPDIDALIACGNRLAALLKLPTVPEHKMRSKMEEILFGRENFECYRQNIITREELKNLILAHMQTLIANNARVDEPSCLEDPDLFRQVDRAIGP